MKIYLPSSFIGLSIIFSSLSFAETSAILSGDELQAIAEKSTTKISTQKLKTMLDNELDMVLIDIRSKNEISNMGGQIDVNQNVNIPRSWIEFRVQRTAVDKKVPIVVYCGAGYRSSFVAKTLQDMGYENVWNYAGGYIAWDKAGLPTSP